MNYADRPLPPRGSARRSPPPVRPSSAPVASTPPPALPATCQASFLAGLIGRVVVLESLGGAERTGTLKRFDTYSLVVEIAGIERLIYKHAVAGLCAAATSRTSA